MSHLNSFLEECVVGVLSIYKNAEIHSVPVYYYYHQVEKAFYFMTKSKSAKIDYLTKNNKASFSIYSERLPRAYNAQCKAEIVDLDGHHKVKAIHIIKRLAEVHSTQEYYPSPIASMKEGELKLIKLKVLDYQFNTYVPEFELSEQSA